MTLTQRLENFKALERTLESVVCTFLNGGADALLFLQVHLLLPQSFRPPVPCVTPESLRFALQRRAIGAG
jgi:hypothetical protein